MRKLLLSILVLGSVAGGAAVAEAAPVPLVPALAGPAQVQPVRWHGHGWRHGGGWRRHHHWAWRRHHWHRHYGFYGRPPLYAYHGW